MVKKILLFCAAIILITVIVIFLIPGKSGKSLPWSKDRQKKYASTLIDRGLYLQAVGEYQKLLDSGNLSDHESANLSYLIGDVYMKNLRDYENALAAYLKVKIYEKNTKLEQELNQRIIECLERTGRSFEAQKEMDKLTLLKKPKEISGGTVVAKLGSREITMKELEEQIRNLPPYMQEMYKSKDCSMMPLNGVIMTGIRIS
jgi:tetratricopeptide (TPR) repeat protein